MRKPRRTSGVDKKGRSKAHHPHVRFYRWEIESPAFRSLSVGARALLIELKALYRGTNNGSLYLSIRRAAERLGCGKNRAYDLFAELQDHGFIAPKQKGAFNVKATTGAGRATTWILTEFPIGDAPGVGTKDFMRWQPPSTQIRGKKIISRSLQEGQSVPLGGTVPLKKALTVPLGGTVLPKNGVRRSLLEGHSYSYHGRNQRRDDVRRKARRLH